MAGIHYAEVKEMKEKAENEAFIFSLPVSWRKFVFRQTHEENWSVTHFNVRKFTAILHGYKRVKDDLEIAISKRTDHQFQYVADLDDFDFDEYVEKLGKADCPTGLRTDELYWHLLTLLEKCLEEKKLLIRKSEEHASINGKPPTVALSYWLTLPQDVRHVIASEDPSKIIEVLVEKFHQLKMEQISILKEKGSPKKVAPNINQIDEKEYKRMKEENKKLKLKNVEIQEDRAAKIENIHYFTERLKEKEREVKELQKLNTDYRNQLYTKNVLSLQQQLAHSKRIIDDLQAQKEALLKEKERLLTRLSEVAGSKLTTNNPAITDLSDENRPIKLAEKFGQVYDDDWTDSLEEILHIGLDEVTSIAFLLRITMSAFHLCQKSNSLFINLRDCKNLLWCDENTKMESLQKIELAEEEKIALENVTQRLKHSRETAFIAASKEKFLGVVKGMLFNISKKRNCGQASKKEFEMFKQQDEMEEGKSKDEDNSEGVDSKDQIHSDSEPISAIRKTKVLSKDVIPLKIRKMDEHRLVESARGDFSMPSHQKYVKEGFLLDKEDVEKLFSTPMDFELISDQMLTGFSKTLQFAEHCLELCWLMQSVQPPVHLDADIPENRRLKTDIFKEYTKKGNKIEYIVWPAMYLHKNGPLLSKGVAQPN
ncbi:uncharacterized protein LOC134254402 [Saccostrea cucullata]|uniref:uncharacterized protein LOC134254402 n=1 Tax=Saccostrea cuccullata TaxID=36930 RepID=UPI002ED69BDE